MIPKDKGFYFRSNKRKYTLCLITLKTHFLEKESGCLRTSYPEESFDVGFWI
jgi:hypothetical protein